MCVFVMQNAIEQLYHTHHTWLYCWLTKRLKQECLAADITQDTFVKIIQHYERYAHYEHPRALLTTIAKNLANQWWRRQKIEQSYEDYLLQLEEVYHPSPEQEFLMFEALVELNNILNRLQVREKEVFFLWQMEGLTYPKIAERLSVSLNTVKRDVKKIMLCCFSVLDNES